MFDSKSTDFPIDCRKTKTKVRSQNTFRGNRELEVKTTKLLKEVVNPYLVFNKTVAYLFNDSTKLHEIWTEDRTYRVQKIDMTYKVPRPPVAMATSENCGSLSILWQTYLSKYIQ